MTADVDDRYFNIIKTILYGSDGATKWNRDEVDALKDMTLDEIYDWVEPWAIANALVPLGE